MFQALGSPIFTSFELQAEWDCYLVGLAIIPVDHIVIDDVGIIFLVGISTVGSRQVRLWVELSVAVDRMRIHVSLLLLLMLLLGF